MTGGTGMAAATPVPCRLLAFIEISNVFDRRNVCCVDWDIDDDGLEYSLDYWMPLLPAIGILWEF